MLSYSESGNNRSETATSPPLKRSSLAFKSSAVISCVTCVASYKEVSCMLIAFWNSLNFSVNKALVRLLVSILLVSL